MKIFKSVSLWNIYKKQIKQKKQYSQQDAGFFQKINETIIYQLFKDKPCANTMMEQQQWSPQLAYFYLI